MIASLVLSSLLAMGDAPPQSSFTCSDAAFHLARDGRDDAVLTGILKTSQRGFIYQFMANPPEEGGRMSVVIKAQQSGGASGRGLPAMGMLEVQQRFNLRPDITRLRIVVEGLSARPFDIICTAGAAG